MSRKWILIGGATWLAIGLAHYLLLPSGAITKGIVSETLKGPLSWT